MSHNKIASFLGHLFLVSLSPSKQYFLILPRISLLCKDYTHTQRVLTIHDFFPILYSRQPSCQPLDLLIYQFFHTIFCPCCLTTLLDLLPHANHDSSTICIHYGLKSDISRTLCKVPSTAVWIKQPSQSMPDKLHTVLILNELFCIYYFSLCDTFLTV